MRRTVVYSMHFDSPESPTPSHNDREKSRLPMWKYDHMTITAAEETRAVTVAEITSERLNRKDLPLGSLEKIGSASSLISVYGVSRSMAESVGNRLADACYAAELWIVGR